MQYRLSESLSETIDHYRPVRHIEKNRTYIIFYYIKTISSFCFYLHQNGKPLLLLEKKALRCILH